jgi:hypothetical protein
MGERHGCVSMDFMVDNGFLSRLVWLGALLLRMEEDEEDDRSLDMVSANRSRLSIDS